MSVLRVTQIVAVLFWLTVAAGTARADCIVAFQNPVVDAGGPVIFISDTQVELKGTASDDGSIAKVEWKQVSGPSEAKLNNADSLTVLVSSLKPGSYVFSLTATDNENNTAVSQIEVRVSASPGGQFVLVPKKIFTPNSDGFNDTWDIQNLSTKPSYTVIIMDTKGQKVLEKTNFSSDVVWDGVGYGYGAYYYVIKDENQKEVRTGSFSLLQ